MLPLFVFPMLALVEARFHPNQHLPLQTEPLRYPYPLPVYQPPQPYKPNDFKHPASDTPTQEELQRQYQQFGISVPNGQPGYVWISAPQYTYYPPPNGNQPNYPPPAPYPYPYPPPEYPYPPPTPETNATTQEDSRDTIRPQPTPEGFNSTENTTDPIVTLSPVETPEPTTDSYLESSTNATDPLNITTTEVYNVSSTGNVTETPSFNVTSTEGINVTESVETTKTPNITTAESTPNSTESYNITTPTSSNTTQNITSTSTPSNTTVNTTTTAPPSNTTENATTTTPSPTNTSNPLKKYCKEPRGQYPSEECSKFVNCWDDVAVEQSCPSGLLFNAEKRYCDYPQNVDCGNATTSNSSSSTNTTSGGSNSTASSKCPESYGTYRNASNCAAFYVCVAGEPVDFICPTGTNFNEELKVCDYPYRVDCGGIPSNPSPEESSTDTVTETTPPPTTTSNQTSSNTTSNSTTTELPPVNETTSNTTISNSTSLNTTESTPSNVTYPAPAQVTEESSYSTIPPPQIDPSATYNFNLKKLPESVVNTGVRCYHNNVFRLTPDCSSVTVCQDGLTYIVNCGSGTSFDALSEKCVPFYRARC